MRRGLERRRLTRRIAAGLLLLAWAMPLHAIPSAAEKEPPLLSPALVYDGTMATLLSGGAGTGSAYIGNAHFRLSVRGDGLGLAGWSGYVDLMNIHGSRPSVLVGDAQGVSNIDGPTGSQVEEFWVQYNGLNRRASALLGIYDLNSEFYRTNAGGLFQNSAFGIGTEFGQSGTEGPSIFPRTSAGLRLAVKPSDDLVLRAAVLDGVPVVRPDGSHGLFRSGDGWLMVAEAAWLSRANVERELKPRRDLIGRQSSRAPYVSKVSIGTWRYTTRLDDLSAVNPTGEPVRRRGSAGVYAVGETPLLADQASIRKLSAFGQLGFADPRTNRFNSYVGAGVVGSGWVPQRADDEVGVSFARSHNGSHYLRSTNSAGARGAETTFEATYLRKVSDHLTLQPDLQYVVHPNTAAALRNAWVFQLRFEVAY